jgi:hypothetical protein
MQFLETGITLRPMGGIDAHATLSFAIAVVLMVYAGLGKRQLRLRRRPSCRHCGLRHLPGNCLRSS